MNMEAVETLFETHANEVADMVVDRQYALQPEIRGKTVEDGRVLRVQDVRRHLDYLKEAVMASSPSLFVNYVIWLKELFYGEDFPESALPVTLECLRDALALRFPKEKADLTGEYIEAALRKLFEPTRGEPSYIQEENPLGELAGAYLSLLLKGDRHAAEKAVLEAVSCGTTVQDIYLHVFQASQYEIGRLWHIGQVSVAQEHYCSAVTERIMSRLSPTIFSTQRIGRSYVGACVGGELHQIGARMVADFFETEGWDTYYLGADVPTTDILHAVVDYKADLLGISCTMSFHRSAMEKLIRNIRKEPAIPRDLKIIVGGYIFSVYPDFYREIGADRMATDAAAAVRTADYLVKDDGNKPSGGID